MQIPVILFYFIGKRSNKMEFSAWWLFNYVKAKVLATYLFPLSISFIAVIITTVSR